MPLIRTEKESIKKLIARSNPSTLGAIIFDSHEIKITRMTVWVRICYRLNSAVRPILDKYGITGTLRIGYYDYSKSLWKFLSRYPESVWDRYIKAKFDYYVQAHQLDPEVLREVTDVTVKTIKEIFSEVEVESVGSNEAGNIDSSKIVGEAGAGGAEAGDS
jgi:hypothetical protein